MNDNFEDAKKNKIDQNYSIDKNLENNIQQSDTATEKPGNKKLTIINIILIAIIFIGLTIYMITVDGLDNIINLLKSVDYRWVITGVRMFNTILDM